MIYIQSNTDKSLPHHFDAACVLYGAQDYGYDYKLVTYDEVNSGKFDRLIKNNLFVGSVEFMEMVFSRIGKTGIKLPRNSNRKCEYITLQEALNKVKDGSKLFIKPAKIKQFTGLVLDGFKHSCLDLISPDTEVLAYEVFTKSIASEYRAYIYKGEVEDIHCYSGDPFAFPSYAYIKSVIKENSDFPIAYTIDIGVLSDEENVVIEFNDMWAIGNYGISNDQYIKLLRERYFEITEAFKYF